MRLSLEQVRHVAKLAWLELSPDQEQRLADQLSAILDAVEQLSTVDTTGVPPTSHVLPGGTHARADDVTGHLPVSQALANAPQHVGSSFAIPRVIE